ncbi:hypothetical protein GUITHDRAFT_111152 [Guillardia theta CCMP2712]|uniref:Citrate transporter-like domain-containing protein n=2 Tax=Guillardia theta TaxID=55529 RepID=L1J2P4_GUITC|nr:hypothetical protein GUITHDRAFT_111152 [Guillardia theta CCMP2712]EKX42783.1 hypothetical protein GUITHDRAFT_111152 [Guillardia theta CCMP2712]|mmetsp:Transcript_34365/g.107755  ORF Transcript_34365/g.107755 Transcript_34365/m.107755 type:complete len:783 (+) Transcript_34365:222-2570(+)|eukprot:XP_005829763.1 hypothetical protein GUITHDRAFT_111152 [Guillardia theta CCMP2712]
MASREGIEELLLANDGSAASASAQDLGSKVSVETGTYISDRGKYSELDSQPGIQDHLSSFFAKFPLSIVCFVCTSVVCAAANFFDAVPEFNWQSWLTICVTIGALLLMANNCPPELVMLAVTIILRLFNVINDDQAWSGFHSQGILAIGVLLVVVKCLEEAGTIEMVVGNFLGRTSNPTIAICRLCCPVVMTSAFINNTPVVAMMIPIVLKWANANQLPPSQLLIPLSYSALLGGMCTLIGTSTNLILQELLLRDKEEGHDPGFQMSFFSITPVAAPVAAVGLIYMTIAARYLLPLDRDRNKGEMKLYPSQDSSNLGGLRIYTVSFVITALASRKSASALGLKRVQGAKLVSIQKGRALSRSTSPCSRGRNVAASSASDTAQDAAGEISESSRPDATAEEPTLPRAENAQEDLSLWEQPLLEGDVLSFLCTADAVSQLRKVEGLQAAAHSRLHAELNRAPKRRRRCLVEVVVDARCPLLGQSVQDADTLSLYNAAIFAVRPSLTSDEYFPLLSGIPQPRLRYERDGRPQDSVQEEQAADAHRECLIRRGDTLLLETYPNFVTNYKDSDHFALVRLIDDSAPPRHNQYKDRIRRLVAGTVFLCMVVLVASQQLSLLVAMLIASYILVGIQCITIHSAFRAIKGRIILAAIAAFGLGEGLTNTHVTSKLAEGMVSIGQSLGPIPLLFLVYLSTACMSCIVSNQATVIIMYSIVKNLQVELSMYKFVVVLIIGASSSFMTPFGYQTNLMVWRAGGYTFADYVYFGVPLTLITGLTTSVLCHLWIP